MLKLALLKGVNHNIKITCNGGISISGYKTGGEAIDAINSFLMDDDYERVVDLGANSETIILVFEGKSKGIVKQFWITIDDEN